MIKSLEVRSFRCFKFLALENLKQINIIVGDNGSGKTALCEALFLPGGVGPEIYFRTRSWRGGVETQFSADRENYESLWRELFYSLDQQQTVVIRFSDSESRERKLRVYYGDRQTELAISLATASTSAAFESATIRPVTFEWTTETGNVFPLTPEFTADGLRLPKMSESYPLIFMSATAVFNAADNAKRFSALSKRQREKTVVDSVRRIFPTVQDLSVEVVGMNPVIHATVKGLPEKLPIGSLSAGLSKYVGILLAVASVPGGVVIIDEIENGFYYTKFASVWDGITHSCEENNTQLFVTTHSMEFLRAALPSVSQKLGSFELLRTEKPDGFCTVKQFSGKEFEAGLVQGIEFR